MGFQLSGAPEPPCVIQIICFLSIAGAPDTRIGKEFGILTESIILSILQSIAHKNRYQHLTSPETDPSQYITYHPGIEMLSKRYQVDVSYPGTCLVYSRHTQRISPNISSLSNGIQAPLISTLLSSVIVSDLTPHAYSIQWLILTCRHSIFTYDLTPDTPLNREYPLCITSQSVAASTQSVICQTQNFLVEARLIPLEPSIISQSMLDQYLPAAASMPNCHAPCKPIHCRKVSTTRLP